MKKALEDTIGGLASRSKQEVTLHLLILVFIDSILKQPFESNSSALLNAILVQVGLIKVQQLHTSVDEFFDSSHLI